MKRVLCISPHFPPVNGADMHRLRQMLPHMEENGWEPVVFSVSPEHIEGAQDPLLTQTLPARLDHHTVGALNPQLTRTFGLGNLGFRCWFQLRSAVNRYLARNHVDLIFFSTTVFAAVAHGPYWQRRFGVPFVVDLQDPWRNDYYLSLPKARRPRKFWFDHWQKSKLEAATMPHAAGLLAVSEAYIETMLSRYPSLSARPMLTLPFSAAQSDFDIAARLSSEEPQADGMVTMRYIGRGGRDMETALTILFRAVRKGLDRDPDHFSTLRLSFQGTSYAVSGRGEKTVEPLAAACGVAELVHENPDRLPYFEALRSLKDADILFIPGSNDAGYTASKLYPYILAGRPLVAVFHKQSSAVEVLTLTNATDTITFDGTGVTEAAINRAYSQLRAYLTGPRLAPETNWAAFQAYSSGAMTSKIAALFERSIAI